jgi:hypothetical protein
LQDIPVEATGSDVPLPISSFDEVTADLGAALIENVSLRE